jgi:hypothetical protein
VQHYVSTLQAQSATPAQHRVTIRQLGPPQSGPVNSSAPSTIAIAALLGVSIIGLLTLLGVEGVRRRVDEAAALRSERLPDFDHLPLYMRSPASPDPDTPTPVSVGRAPTEHRT